MSEIDSTNPGSTSTTDDKNHDMTELVTEQVEEVTTGGLQEDPPQKDEDQD